jgi:hypothetical protein
VPRNVARHRPSMRGQLACGPELITSALAAAVCNGAATHSDSTGSPVTLLDPRPGSLTGLSHGRYRVTRVAGLGEEHDVMIHWRVGWRWWIGTLGMPLDSAAPLGGCCSLPAQHHFHGRPSGGWRRPLPVTTALSLAITGARGRRGGRYVPCSPRDTRPDAAHRVRY